MNPVAVMFRHLRPYHRARLNAAAKEFPILALELFDRDENGETHASQSDDAFAQVTLSAKHFCVTELTRVLDLHRPSVVAIPGWWEPACLAAIAWGRRHDVPVIVMSDSQVGDRRRRWPREWVKRRLVNRCAAALAAGKPHVEYLVSLGLAPEQIFTGFDVVDNDYFARGAEAARLEANETRTRLRLPSNYFLASARFIARKNLSRLIEAYAGYRRQAGHAAWSLVVLGDGPLRARLESQVRSLGLEAQVLFPGERPYEELPAYYGLARALVHVSTHEQWGLVVNEAMAAGLPVIVSKACGCALDLIVPGVNGAVVDPLDTSNIRQNLREMAARTDAQRAEMGRASRDLIASWSPQTFARGLRHAVEAACRCRAPRPNPLARLIDHCLLRTLMERTA